MKFEPYDYRMGCVAVQHNGKYWVVRPNGHATEVKTMEIAQSQARYMNATASTDERNEWRRPSN